MTDQEKIDILYSKYAIVSPNSESVFNSQIWRDGSDIPSNAPSFDQDGFFRNSKGKAILKKLQYVEMRRMSSDKYAFTSSEVYDVVCFDSGFDPSYRVQFFNRTNQGNYIEMPYSQGDVFFDSDSGVLILTNGLKGLYDKNRVYISFIRYEGDKGFNTLSQFPSFPDVGPTGPTGPTGQTGDTGPTKPGSFRYRGSWDVDSSYSRWNVVKYEGKFYFSSVDFNDRSPVDAPFWLPFGAEQFRESFSYPASTVFVSPGFPNISNLASNLQHAFDYIDITGASSMIIYPGDYVLEDSIDCAASAQLRMTFIGHVTVSFDGGASHISFTDGSKIELCGNDFSFNDGTISLSDSSLQVNGGKIHDIEMITTGLTDVSRLMLTDSTVNNIICYSSLAIFTRSCIRGTIEMDELSSVRFEACHFTGENENQTVIDIISADDSGVPSSYGMSNPSLLIRNSRVISNSSDIIAYTGSSSVQHGLKVGIVSSSMYDTAESGTVNQYDYPVDTLFYDVCHNVSYDSSPIIVFEGIIQEVNSFVAKENI
jgi:hypothetical protein